MNRIPLAPDREMGVANRLLAAGSMAQSSFGEYKFYRFGLHLGISHLLANGFSLGVRKTMGKIAQPINSYTRFPEYALLEENIGSFCDARGSDVPANILDVGSPKCFGLFLASTRRCTVEMTDLSPLNLDHYKVMWNSIRAQAKGHARFSLQDARALSFEESSFDIVYSMSVLEHVSGESGDSAGLSEMIRVLKPGGLLLLSVPFGPVYTEQWRNGFAGAIEERNDGNYHFFQRIYDSQALQTRLLRPLETFNDCSIWTVWRPRSVFVRALAHLGQNVRGALGILNPLLSSGLNHCAQGILEGIPSHYGQIHSPDDLCGDVIIVVRKCS
ncbi:MAG TPA: class I SAM-dependent methyltransferase [Candidatus Acidoferrum sp.]|nr:class I SAM-dependent methyltransferase [Candidatus Acidoferrum sp.]